MARSLVGLVVRRRSSGLGGTDVRFVLRPHRGRQAEMHKRNLPIPTDVDGVSREVGYWLIRDVVKSKARLMDRTPSLDRKLGKYPITSYKVTALTLALSQR